MWSSGISEVPPNAAASEGVRSVSPRRRTPGHTISQTIRVIRRRECSFQRFSLFITGRTPRLNTEAPSFASSKIWRSIALKKAGVWSTHGAPECGSSTERLNGISRARRIPAFWQLTARSCRSSELPISGIMRREQLEVAWKRSVRYRVSALHSLI